MKGNLHFICQEIMQGKWVFVKPEQLDFIKKAFDPEHLIITEKPNGYIVELDKRFL